MLRPDMNPRLPPHSSVLGVSTRIATRAVVWFSQETGGYRRKSRQYRSRIALKYCTRACTCKIVYR
jgi:hypothetical protein